MKAHIPNMIPPREYNLPEPPSANRWWRNWRGRMVLSDEARDYKDEIAWTHRSTIPLSGDVSVGIEWCRSRKAGDLDKRIGILLDALQGVAFVNDSQVVEIVARRWDKKDGKDLAPGRVLVKVKQL